VNWLTKKISFFCQEVSAASEITCLVEFVIGVFFFKQVFSSHRYSPHFVVAEQLRRANLVYNDTPSVVNCNDLGNVTTNVATYRALQATALHSSFEMYLHVMECLLKSFSMHMGT